MFQKLIILVLTVETKDGDWTNRFITNYEDNYPSDKPCDWVCVLEYTVFVTVIVVCLAFQ